MLHYFKNIILLIFCVLILQQCKSKDSSPKYTYSKTQLKKIPNEVRFLYIDSLLNTASLKKADKAMLFYEKGKLLNNLQKDNEAIVVFEDALLWFKEIGDEKYVAKTYMLLANSNIFINKKELANEQLFKALEYAKAKEDLSLEAAIYSVMAHLYFLTKDYEKSIDYIQKSISIQKMQRDSVALSSTYNNLAVLYKNIGNYTEALNYNIESLNLNLSLNDPSAIAKSYNNLGQVNEQLGDYPNALLYYKKAAVKNEENQVLNSSPLKNLGSFYLRIDSVAKAKKYYEKALAIENKLSRYSVLKELYNVLLYIELQNKNFEKSMLYQDKRDSINIKELEFENAEKLISIENKYKLAERTKDLELQKKNNNKNRLILIMLLSFGVLLSLFWYQKTKNTQLKLNEEKIRLEQKVLRSQMNPHFIFNALSAIQNSLLDKDPIKSASYLSKFAKLIRQNFDFINQKKITLEEEIDSLKNYMDTQKLRFENKFEYDIKVDSSINISSAEIPPLLLQPFIENSIEHGFKNKKEKGLIRLNISQQNNYIHYEISDNGIGFSPQKKDTKEHALDVFKKRLKLLGNKDEQTIKIYSSPEGTSIQFSLLSI